MQGSCTRSRMDTIPNGTIPNGHNPEWTQSRMVTIPNGHNPEWTPMDTIPNGHITEWTPMDTIPNGHDPEWGLTSYWRVLLLLLGKISFTKTRIWTKINSLIDFKWSVKQYWNSMLLLSNTFFLLCKVWKPAISKMLQKYLFSKYENLR